MTPEQQVCQQHSARITSAGGTADHAAHIARRRLAECSYLGLKDVLCSSENGILWLHGRVASYHLKQMAQELVRQTEGVRAIENRLEVESSRPAPAGEL